MHRSLTLLVAAAVTTSMLAVPPQRDSADPVAGNSFELKNRQFIIEPQRVLSAADQAELASAGIVVQKVLGAGRYLVRATGEDAVAGAERLIRSFEPLTPEGKLHPTAAREISRPVLASRLSVVFDEHVSFDEAQALIARAGGRPESLLAYEFDPLQRIVAKIPASGVAAIAADPRVLAVYGAPKLAIESHNATSATLSNVTPLYSAPYDLTGKDVMLSFFELTSALATHTEFGDRLTNTLTSAAGNHATHVAGTMIAAGTGNASAKGMAPAAKATGYGVSSSYLRTKRDQLKVIGSAGDNNSWGYVLGWNYNEDIGAWVWTGNSDLYGAYIDENAALDQVARSNNILMMHSSGNDASKNGPNAPPYSHRHEDENGDPIVDKLYCYSVNGSGADCPTDQCTAGPDYCEINRHPVSVPFTSVGLLASSKNVLTVGAVSDASFVASFSSRGPTRDGRVKPEIVAKGVSVFSTTSNGSYGRLSGTSMATPAVTGMTALLVEQYRRTFAGATPSAMVLKTLLIAGTQDMGAPGPDYTHGFGLANAKASVDLIRDDNATGSRIRSGEAAQGAQLEFPVTIAAAQPFRATLSWPDPEVLLFGDDGTAALALVNDLDLKVIDANGATVLPYVLDKNNPTADATRGVNTVDNTEMVEIANAAPGSYKVIVSGTRIAASSPQQFALVTNAPMAAAAPPCVDATEPNDTAETGYGLLASGQNVMGRLCAANDVDFFRFRPDRAGVVSVTVSATGTPVRVTLAGNGGEASVDVPAGQSKVVQLNFTGNTATVFTARVQVNGTLGANASYFVTPTFGLSAPNRRRAR